MFRLICVLALLGVAFGDTVVLNQVIDQLINGLNQQLVQNGKDTIHVEDMNNNWRYRWHFLKLSGHVNCHDGYARSLASLRRTGDVVMTTQGNTVVLKAALGLGTLEFGFQHCQVKAKHLFSVTQHVKATVSSNSIEAQVTLVKNGNQCVANVDHISLNNLGSIKINTGGSVLHKIEDKLLNWLINHFHSKIKSSINNSLVDAARNNIGKADLCNKIPH